MVALSIALKVVFVAFFLVVGVVAFMVMVTSSEKFKDERWYEYTSVIVALLLYFWLLKDFAIGFFN